LTKSALGWDGEPFFVPEEAYEFLGSAAEAGRMEHANWEGMVAAWSEANPDLKSVLDGLLSGKPPVGWEAELASTFEPGSSVATRKASGAVISVLKKRWPSLVGGSADLTPSNNTRGNDDEAISAENYAGRYIHFGIREHAMASIINGMNVHGGLRAYGGTFLIFSDYMRPAIRLSALMNVPSLFVFTHDGIGLGEDGPTHQPIEHLAALRAIPNLAVFRPADANETILAWKTMAEMDGPSAIALTRQGLPVLPRQDVAGAARGGYILKDHSDASVILIATGSEVHIALEASGLLQARGVAARVVSLPCWEVFENQSDEYRESVLPRSISARVSIEAGSTLGWERYTGSDGVTIGLDRFGASAPYKEIYQNLGLTPEAVTRAALESISRVAGS